MTYNAMTQKCSSNAAQSTDEDFEEKLGACDPADISECCGTSTVKNFPTIDTLYADNGAFNKMQTRGV